METQALQGHTPGPWEVRRAKNQHLSEAGDRKTFPVVNGWCCSVGQYEREPEVQEANARLIAAAPKMLEALKRVRYFHRTNDTPNSDPWLDVDAAIDMAEGRKP